MTEYLRRAHGQRDEAGFTLIELSITMVLMALIAGSILTLLASFMQNERVQDARITNQESVRFNMISMAQDLRSSNPMYGQDASLDYATQFTVALGPSTGTQTYVRWRVSGENLVRETLTSPTGTVISTKTSLLNIVNDATTPLFRYYDPAGAELATSGTNAASPADIQNCTIRVKITIVAQPAEMSPTSFTETSDVELRNRLPGGIGC